MSKAAYTKCHHLQANPERFDDRDIWRERLSNKHVWTGCHDCLKAHIAERWARENPRLLERMRRVDLVTIEGGTVHAPEGLLEKVVTALEMPGGEIVMMPGLRISEAYRLPETIREMIPEPDAVESKPVEEIPETIPDTVELRAFLAPVVAANEKFVALWKQGKTGPLIGAAMRAAAGKYEGKFVEKALKEIVGGPEAV